MGQLGAFAMDEAALWSLEEKFWLEGPGFHRTHLDPDCVMAFPGMGIVRMDTILAGLEAAPRWAAVKMQDRAAGRAGDVAVLGYRAEARRPGAEPYRCLCTSTYRRNGDTWRLVQHQQTLAE